MFKITVEIWDTEHNCLAFKDAYTTPTIERASEMFREVKSSLVGLDYVLLHAMVNDAWELAATYSPCKTSGLYVNREFIPQSISL